MRLLVVPCQLRLFEFKMDPVLCAEIVDGRTGNQWLKSVLAYLDFRAGNAWRRMDDGAHRRAPERWEYLDAIRFIESVRNAPVREPKERPVLATVSPAAPEHVDARSVYVDRLMALRPELTNRKLLSGFSKAKLNRMIDEARTQKPLEFERAG